MKNDINCIIKKKYYNLLNLFQNVMKDSKLSNSLSTYLTLITAT